MKLVTFSTYPNEIHLHTKEVTFHTVNKASLHYNKTLENNQRIFERSLSFYAILCAFCSETFLFPSLFISIFIMPN